MSKQTTKTRREKQLETLLRAAYERRDDVTVCEKGLEWFRKVRKALNEPAETKQVVSNITVSVIIDEDTDEYDIEYEVIAYLGKKKLYAEITMIDGKTCPD